MSDVLMVGLVVVLFLVSALYVAWCDRILGGAGATADASHDLSAPTTTGPIGVQS